MALPLPLLPVPRIQFCDGNGAPLSGGSLSFLEAGTSTPKVVYADANGETPLGTIVTLDDDGRAPAIYLAVDEGYKVVLTDADGAQVWSQDDIEDPAAVFINTLGNLWTGGSKDVTSGYEVTNDDYLVTVNEPSTNPATVVLQAAADRTQILIIKNVGPTAVNVTPTGSETIDGVAAAFSLPAATSPDFPTITLLSDGISNYWISASHALS